MMAGIKGMASPNQVPPMEGQPPIIPQAPEMPQVAQQPPTPQKPSLDEIFAQGGAVASSQKPSLDEIFSGGAPTDEFTTEPIGMMEELGNFPARLKAGMQVTDKELQTSLEQSFGKDKVRKKDGMIQYKADDGKWREWDAGTEISDFTTDMIRPIVEEIPATLGTLAAGIPGAAATVASGGTAAPAAIAATAAARSVGAVSGLALADWLQSLTGVPRDEDRSRLLEYGLTATVAPLSGAAADWATKKIAQRAATSASRKLLAPEALYKEEIGGIKEGLEKIKSLGGLENIPGTDTPIMLSQMNPSNPMAREITEKASSLNGFKQAQEQITQGFEDSSKAFLRTLGNISPENNATGQEFKNYVQSAIKKEGQAIGAVRDGLVEAAGNGELPVPKLKGNVEEFAKELGFQIGGETNLAGLKNFLVDEQGYSKQAAEVIVNKTNKMLERVTNKEGRMTAKEIVGAYEELNGLYRNLAQGGGEVSPLFRSKVGQLRRFFADELADKVEVISDKGAKNSYLNDLKNYRELVTAADEFSSLLDKDNLASHSLSKAIFSKGANGLDTAEAAKVLLRDRPDLLNDVKGSFLQDVLADSFNEATKKTDWGKFHKKLSNPELRPVMQSLFGKDAIEGLKAYETVGKAIQAGSVGAASSPERARFVKGLASIPRSAVDAGKAGIDLLMQSDPDGLLAEAISKEGIDNFLKTAPKDSKPILKRLLSGFQEAALKASQVAPLPLRRSTKEPSRKRANQMNQAEEGL